jgi:hypothetical protein
MEQQKQTVDVQAVISQAVNVAMDNLEGPGLIR